MGQLSLDCPFKLCFTLSEISFAFALIFFIIVYIKLTTVLPFYDIPWFLFDFLQTETQMCFLCFVYLQKRVGCYTFKALCSNSLY